MSAGNGGQAVEFRRAMEALASDPDGWSGAAGDEFVSLMRRVLARMIAGQRRSVGDGSSSVEPADAVAEAVLVVSGSGRLSLAENVHRILELERPLGYVIGAVAKNLSRAELAGEMGIDSRQVSPGVPRVLHLYEVESSMESDPLDRLSARPAWVRGRGEASREARATVDSFVGILAQRFKVRPDISRRALEIAGTSAVDGDMGVGLTPATARRRTSRFLKELPAMRGAFDRVQAQAFAWLVFGTERHPEWSLLAECARAVRKGDAVTVSPWHARHARTVAGRPGQVRREESRQPALFPLTVEKARTRRISA